MCIWIGSLRFISKELVKLGEVLPKVDIKTSNTFREPIR